MIIEMLGGAAIAALVSLFACRLVMLAGPVDAPDAARKAHATPTRTSGGLGIAAGVAVALIVMSFFSETMRTDVQPRDALLLIEAALFAGLFMLIGFWDDARPLSARLKFVLFTAAAVAATITVGAVGRFPIGEGEALALPYWLALAGTVLWVFTLVNSVNFMDGANGLSMGSSAIALLALAAISYTHGSMAGVILCLCAVGALAGFLFWNFPAGRLFAGDAGALFVGGIGALASLVVIHRTGLSPLIPPILFFPLLADVLVTLAWRAWRRRSLLDGHSEHLYQIARHGGMSPAEVTLIYWAATAACGAVGFVLADQPLITSVVALGAMAFAAIVISTAVRRFADRRGIEGV